MTRTIYKNLFAKLTLCAAIFCAAISIHAQTTAFTYQGKLTDNSMPPPAAYDMQFKLFDTPTVGSGTQQGSTVNRSPVSVTNGVFTVQLDFGDAYYTASNLYLEVSVRPAGGANYTTLSPRQQMTSAPMAVQARKALSALDAVSAENLNGIPADDYALVSDSRFTDNRSPTAGSSFYVQNNSTTTAQTGSFNLTGSGKLGGSFSAGGATLTGLTVGGNLSQTGTTADLSLTNGFLARGTFNAGAIPATGAGTRMMFYPRKAAFRAGEVGGTQWDDANIGNNSTAMGLSTTASGPSSTAMGFGTVASGDFSTATGYKTTASGSYSTAMGNTTTASGYHSVALGYNTTASGLNSIATGYGTDATGIYTTAIGHTTLASGDYSTAIGNMSTAPGDYSIAIGYKSYAYGDHSVVLGNYGNTTIQAPGSFIFGDNSSSNNIVSYIPNQFVVRAQNIWFGKTSSPTNTANRFIETSTGAYLSNSGVWTDNSSVNLKTNFAALDARDVLRKVLNLRIQSWNYKADTPDIRHIGVMAQDFYQAFKIGADDEHITAVDTAGVTMAAIQGLNAELNERATKLETENDSLKKQLKTQQTQITRQQTAIDALTKLICANNPAADVCRQEEK